MNRYKSFGQLQNSGHIQFKKGISEHVLLNIRKIQILKCGGFYMKINPKSIQLQSNNPPTQQQITQRLIWALSVVESANLEQVGFFKVQKIYSSKLLVTFAAINFYQLECLNLNDCDLGSIEFLTFLVLPQLKILHLSCNQLTNLNGFAKCAFPKLYSIYLYYNEIKDAKGFYRSLLGPILAVLQVAQKQSKKNPNTFTYLSTWFFKLPFEFVNYIRKKENRYLFKNIHMQKALQKYPYASFR